MMAAMNSIILLLILLILNVNSFQINHKRSLYSNKIKSSSLTQLYGRASKVEEKGNYVTADTPDDEETVPLPFTGLIGQQGGGLFEKPLEVYDPTKDIMDVPGADGSEEQASAMQRKIQERVDALKQAGQYEQIDSEFGADPLTKIPLYSVMWSQLKAAKPFETWDEFGLTYALVALTTALLMGYVFGITNAIDNFIEWFEKTDFDFLNSILSSS